MVLLLLAGIAVLRAQYKSLATHLDAQTVAAHLYQRKAITLKDLQKIRYLRGLPIEAAEWLLIIIMEQPDAVFLYFLDVLKETEQHYVYERLAADSYDGQCDNVVAMSNVY